MKGFKILKNSNGLNIKHIRAKCRKTNEEFIIRLEYEKNGWYMVYATKVEPSKLSTDTTVKTINNEFKFDDGLFVGNDYACPFCGEKNIVKCGACGKITCNNDSKHFKCAYCGNSGEIGGKISSIFVENYSNSKKK